jgi:flagellar biosynthesis component FlhA
MTPELQATAYALLTLVLTGLTLFGKTAIQRLQAELEKNTHLTKQVEAQTNGELAKARNQAQKAMAAYYRSCKVQREQAWLIEQLQRTEEGRALIDRVMQARRSVVYDADYDELMTRLLRESGDKKA